MLSYYHAVRVLGASAYNAAPFPVFQDRFLIANVVMQADFPAERYDGKPDTCYLIRPDQHVAARWRRFDPAQIRAALTRATAQENP